MKGPCESSPTCGTGSPPGPASPGLAPAKRAEDSCGLSRRDFEWCIDGGLPSTKTHTIPLDAGAAAAASSGI
eukprot:scaffold3258_cov382-Prasinococcus_capsulatus_cf.AAC.6